MKDILAEGVPPTNVIGVTDGSNAPPGMVGEYVTSVAAGSMTGPNIIIPAITVPPGDWMVDFTFSLDMATGGTFTEFVAIIPANQRPEGMEPTESPIVASLNQGGSPPSEGFQALVMPGSTIRITTRRRSSWSCRCSSSRRSTPGRRRCTICSPRRAGCGDMPAFPSSPTVGQVFQSWQWTGQRWDQYPPSGLVTSVNGRRGAVVMTVADFPELQTAL